MGEKYSQWWNLLHVSSPGVLPSHLVDCLPITRGGRKFFFFFSTRLNERIYDIYVCFEEGVLVHEFIWLLSIFRRETRCTHPSQEYLKASCEWWQVSGNVPLDVVVWWPVPGLGGQDWWLSVVKQGSFCEPSLWLGLKEVQSLVLEPGSLEPSSWTVWFWLP